MAIEKCKKAFLADFHWTKNGLLEMAKRSSLEKNNEYYKILATMNIILSLKTQFYGDIIIINFSMKFPTNIQNYTD